MGSASTRHLSLGNYVHQLEAARQNPGAAKNPEPEHGSDAPLDRAMVMVG
jgi:hypothetical protein